MPVTLAAPKSLSVIIIIISHRTKSIFGAVLLTGGLLVRVQPEEPIFSIICGRPPFRLIFTLPFWRGPCQPRVQLANDCTNDAGLFSAHFALTAQQ